MTNRMPIGPRGSQILRLLFEHGPLSPTTLRNVIEPPMSQRKMSEAIFRLKDLGLVRKRHSSISDKNNHYVELSQKQDSKRILKALLDVKEADLKKIPGGTEALEHWQDCVLWAKHFQTILGQAKIVHDFQMCRSPEIRKLFRLSEKAKYHAYPDLLILLEKDDGGVCTIAVEVERTEKKGFRIIRKLKTLAMTSEIDGVLYICQTPRVAQKISRIYTTHVEPRAYRIERYVDQFLMISDGTINRENGMIKTTDLKGSGINPVAWMMKLRATQEDSAAWVS